MRRTVRSGAVLGAGLTAAVVLAGSTAAVPAGEGPSTPRPFHAEAPPAGHTGGFGEADCTACHLEAGPNLPGGSLELRGVPQAWSPGERYTLEVVLRAQGTVRAGFQLSARHPGGGRAGRLEAVDGRVQILAPDSLPAEYAAQTRRGSEARSSAGARWSVAWTAPAAGGPVRFHAAANSADGDESPLGDLVYTTAVESRPSTTGATPQP